MRFECKHCGTVRHIEPTPKVHCSCGKVTRFGDYKQPQGKRERDNRPFPRTYSSILREMVGCACHGVPWSKYDRLGLDWCRDNADEIASMLVHVSKVKPDLADRLTAAALKLASRYPTNYAKLITFHWNPNGFRRLRDTYYEWIKTVGHPVTCYELVIGDAEPEIKGSVVVRGDDRNILWQKERLINLAIAELGPSVRYVGWLDHDLCFENDRWLDDAVEMMDAGADAVQPFSSIRYLDRHGGTDRVTRGAVATLKDGKEPHTAPGGAWLVRRDYLDRTAGLYDRGIVGGGDSIWFSAMTKARTRFLRRQPPASQRSAEDWIAAAPDAVADCLPGQVVHLWHGDRENRQYVERDAILRDHGYDPEKHLEIDARGLLRWSDAAPVGLVDAVRKYFADRRDDG